MNKHFQATTLKATGASSLFEIEVIQSLWSGYGDIVRYGLMGCDINSVVAKHVRLPTKMQHPRGWNSNLSHQRKIRSYQVETAWYKQWNKACDANCRTPHCLALEEQESEVFMLLEDLNAAGFPTRRSTVSTDEIKLCLPWLANFHATL